MRPGPYSRACTLLLVSALWITAAAQGLPNSKPVVLTPTAEQDLTRVGVQQAQALRRDFVKLYKNGLMFARVSHAVEQKATEEVCHIADPKSVYLAKHLKQHQRCLQLKRKRK